MDNLSEKIKKRRLEKKMTIEDLSKETFLSVAVIKDIEAGKFDEYEGDETYVKMYLKKISDALDLNREELTQSYVALTQEIKLAQLKEKEEIENKQEQLINKRKSFTFEAPQFARKSSVYEDKYHIKILRAVIVILLIAILFGVLWWGISSTKSQVDNPNFDPQQSTTIEGDIGNDNETQLPNNDLTQDDNTSEVNFTRIDKLDFEFTLPENEKEFVFKIVFANKSWASLKVNGRDYSQFDAKIYQKEDEVQLTFNVDDFNKLSLKNGYSMGHKYYINGVEIPLIEDDYSEGVTTFELLLKK